MTICPNKNTLDEKSRNIVARPRHPPDSRRPACPPPPRGCSASESEIVVAPAAGQGAMSSVLSAHQGSGLQSSTSTCHAAAGSHAEASCTVHVMRHGHGRYFTILRDVSPPLLIWKDGKLEGDVMATEFSLTRGCRLDTDASTTSGISPAQAERPGVFLAMSRTQSMTHNAAVMRTGERVVALGGVHLNSKAFGLQTGIRLVQWSLNSTWSRDWRSGQHSSAVLVLNGTHPGCIERLEPDRIRIPGVCEFDGRLSLAVLHGRYHLFARMNPARRGSRFVQTTSSADLVHWNRFRPLRFKGIGGREGHEGAGEIYTFGAQPHPWNASWLLAIFPYLPLNESQKQMARALPQELKSPRAVCPHVPTHPFACASEHSNMLHHSTTATDDRHTSLQQDRVYIPRASLPRTATQPCLVDRRAHRLLCYPLHAYIASSVRWHTTYSHTFGLVTGSACAGRLAATATSGQRWASNRVAERSVRRSTPPGTSPSRAHTMAYTGHGPIIFLIAVPVFRLRT